MVFLDVVTYPFLLIYYYKMISYFHDIIIKRRIYGNQFRHLDCLFHNDELEKISHTLNHTEWGFAIGA